MCYKKMSDNSTTWSCNTLKFKDPTEFCNHSFELWRGFSAWHCNCSALFYIKTAAHRSHPVKSTALRHNVYFTGQADRHR